ncbi:MAG: S1 RNA-binding domain-containing protein [Candidatus Kapaibacterium sp.]
MANEETLNNQNSENENLKPENADTTPKKEEEIQQGQDNDSGINTGAEQTPEPEKDPEKDNAPEQAQSPAEQDSPKPQESAEENTSSEETQNAAADETASKDKARAVSEEDKGSAAPDLAPGSAAAERQKQYDEVFAELQQIHDKNETFEVEVKSRIRGGLRVMYKDMPLFLPASHFSLKRNPSDEEFKNVTGKNIDVKVHELHEEDSRKTVIVSRKSILEKDFWEKINVGDKVVGTVSSIAKFGIFLDLGGIEGLIHISRLSQVHVNDPHDFAAKGDKMEAVVVDYDKKKNRIALSRKELEESPWTGVSDRFEKGKIYKGTVKRIADFGTYIEMETGVEGLLRNSELSWTKRVKNPAEVVQENQELEVMVVDINEQKNTMSLSLKRTQENPWETLKGKYPVGTELKGTVTQVVPQGAIINIENEVDGFMPRSKMRSLLKGKKIPFSPGDQIDVKISDLVPSEESLILSPQEEEIAARRPAHTRSEASEPQNAGSFSFGDLLSDKEKNELFDKLSK